MAYISISLRYNSPLCMNNQVESYLQYSTEVVSEKLADILTEYLSGNWAKVPAKFRNITVTTNMVTELQLDSFQVMEFMLEVEDHFDVAIDLESLANISTIADLAAVVIAAFEEQ